MYLVLGCRLPNKVWHTPANTWTVYARSSLLLINVFSGAWIMLRHMLRWEAADAGFTDLIRVDSFILRSFHGAHNPQFNYGGRSLIIIMWCPCQVSMNILIRSPWNCRFVTAKFKSNWQFSTNKRIYAAHDREMVAD